MGQQLEMNNIIPFLLAMLQMQGKNPQLVTWEKKLLQEGITSQRQLGKTCQMKKVNCLQRMMGMQTMGMA